MRHDNDTPARRRGLGLRTKLTLGFVVLLAILLAVGVESISLLDRLGGSIDVILRENYVSVIACEQMKESLERMDSGALFALAGHAEQGRALAAQNRPRFEKALQTELGNITLAGEGERAERLRQLYAAYVPILEQILAPAGVPETKRALYFERLLPTFQQIKTTADEILQMNQQNMVEANDRARELAADASRRMALLLLAGVAVAGLCVAFLSRAILGPLERLTRAAGEIERGNLDQAVPVTSGDELGQLAAAFNSMAGGLRELRESDQARLLHAQRTSQLAFDSLPQAVAVFSADRQVEMANRAAAALDLRPGEPVPAQHAAWLLPLLDRSQGRLPERSAEEAVRLPVAGHERFFLPRTAILSGGPGESPGILVVLEDVTDQRRGAEVHAGLLANAARDLQGALGRLRPALDSVGAEGGIRDDVLRLEQVTENLLAMSRLEERRQQLHLEPVAPRDLIDAAVREMAASYAAEQVELVTDVDPEAPPVLVDRERAELLLPALLRNALAHTPAGGAVTVRAEPWEGRARFSVTDTGSGVPAAYRELIFEPLYQVPGEQDAAGAGMGLAIARDIVQAHGGEIHCESEEGRGATFWFTLPAANL
jgi:signal transduction histidine kinase